MRSFAPSRSKVKSKQYLTGSDGNLGEIVFVQRRFRVSGRKTLRRPPEDVFMVDYVPHLEAVLADLCEPLPGVEALGAVVLRPDADPHRARALRLQPGDGLGEEPRAQAAALPGFSEIDAL